MGKISFMAFKTSYNEKYFKTLFYNAKENSLRDRRKLEEIFKYKKGENNYQVLE